MSSLYLIINIASISIPFLYSFEKRMNFIKWWKEVFLAIIIVGSFFIAWDIVFTQQGIWGFNSNYLVGINLLNLPIEEWLFFICIPYASIFTHYAFQYFLPNFKLSDNITKIITISLIVVFSIVVVINIERAYTFYSFLLLLMILWYSLLVKNKQLNVFYISFFLILIPFLMVNGLLTGSFIEEPVVWYNNAENLGIRLFTIPMEDFIYAFNLLFLNILLIEKFKTIRSKK